MTASTVDRHKALRAATWRLACAAMGLQGALTLIHPAKTPTERAKELRQAWAEIEPLLTLQERETV